MGELPVLCRLHHMGVCFQTQNSSFLEISPGDPKGRFQLKIPNVLMTHSTTKMLTFRNFVLTPVKERFVLGEVRVFVSLETKGVLHPKVGELRGSVSPKGKTV